MKNHEKKVLIATLGVLLTGCQAVMPANSTCTRFEQYEHKQYQVVDGKMEQRPSTYSHDCMRWHCDSGYVPVGERTVHDAEGRPYTNPDACVPADEAPAKTPGAGLSARGNTGRCRMPDKGTAGAW